MALSNRIRELRFKNGEMTQKRLAELAGVSRQTMNAIENSKHAPTIDLAIRIADVFGVAVNDLFECTYEGKPRRCPDLADATSVRRKAPTIAIDRPEVTVEKPIEIKGEVEPAEKEAGHAISFASLRSVVGP